MILDVVTRIWGWVVENIIYNPNFWDVMDSIGTCFMAILTYRHLKFYKKVDEERIRREMIENLISPLIESLKKISSQAERSYIPTFPCIKEGDKYIEISISEYWPMLKKEYPYLISILPQSLKKNIENFYKNLEEKSINSQELKEKAEELIKNLESYYYEPSRKKIYKKIMKIIRK